MKSGCLRTEYSGNVVGMSNQYSRYLGCSIKKSRHIGFVFSCRSWAGHHGRFFIELLRGWLGFADPPSEVWSSKRFLNSGARQRRALREAVGYCLLLVACCCCTTALHFGICAFSPTRTKKLVLNKQLLRHIFAGGERRGERRRHLAHLSSATLPRLAGLHSGSGGGGGEGGRGVLFSFLSVKSQK
jgi:hypothetical protein